MTGSESSNGTTHKGGKSPRSSHHHQQRDKTDSSTTPADQLRRLAIKNSFGCKSLPTGSSSLLSKALSSSTSSLDRLPGLGAAARSNNVVGSSGSSISSCKLPQISVSLEDAEQQAPQKSSKTSPYITRQQLLQSLRRTTSNSRSSGSNSRSSGGSGGGGGVRLMQTICSSDSSYIHHTPRHLLRTAYNNPRSCVSRSATTIKVTPDSSSLWASKLRLLQDGGGSSLITGKEEEEEETESCCGETQSLLNLPSSRLSPPKMAAARHQEEEGQTTAAVDTTLVGAGPLASAPPASRHDHSQAKYHKVSANTVGQWPLQNWAKLRCKEEIILSLPSSQHDQIIISSHSISSSPISPPLNLGLIEMPRQCPVGNWREG